MDMKDSILINAKNATVSNRYELEQRRTKMLSTHSNGYSKPEQLQEKEIGRNGNQRIILKTELTHLDKLLLKEPQRKEIIPKTERFLQEKVGHKEMKVKEIILKPELSRQTAPQRTETQRQFSR
jgi:hypothetical protein